MRGTRFCLLLLTSSLLHGHPPPGEAEILWSDAVAAEAQLDTGRALELLLRLEKIRPDEPQILRKIARQYSDRVVDLVDPMEKKKSVEQALVYARRAVDREPRNAENALSLAICHGKRAMLSGTREKVESSRLVRELVEQALTIDPEYAWAHHLLGRWHVEVSELNSTAKILVWVFHGGLPAASSAAAVHHLERAVALDPGQLQHWLELGFAYRARGDLARSREAFARGLTMPSREKHDESAKDRARAALEVLR